MPHHKNPFMNRYQALSSTRLLAISTGQGVPLLYLPLHASQASLSDEQVQQRPVLFSNEFAILKSGATAILKKSFPTSGWAQAVIHAVTDEEDGGRVHVCDTYTQDAAEEVIKQLRLEGSCRCREISTAHLCMRSLHYLHHMIHRDHQSGLLFEAFYVADERIVAIKLLSTPWTDESLLLTDGRTEQALQAEHRRAGVPEMLLNVVHLAGQADVRFLIFDPDANELVGLPVHGEDDAAPAQGEFTY